MKQDTKSDSRISGQLKDKEVLDLLEKANNQYENYLDLASLDYEDKRDINHYNPIKRDINYPLNIVIR